MKKYLLLITVAAFTSGCIAPAGMEVQVAPLGQEVPETTEQYLYALPQTVLKVEIACQEIRHVPGPFREYADKYLGIREVIRQNFSEWQILDVKVTPHAELDPSMLYHVNVLKGEFGREWLQPFLERGIILDGTECVFEQVKDPALEAGVFRDHVDFSDLGIESNFEERTETMYKTIVTDTSFVQVPVDRTITEQKSPAKKAQEAADFLLELRTRRFELLTGGYEGFPQGVAMKAALARLDELEASYLSLFAGKTFGRKVTMAWFVVPEAGTGPTRYRLGMFSEQLGFVPEDLMEGEPVELTIEPLGKTRDVGAYYAGKAGTNELLYRVPDVADLKVMQGGTVLAEQRISVYQSGAVVAAPLK
jgi:hypothetical protein